MRREKRNSRCTLIAEETHCLKWAYTSPSRTVQKVCFQSSEGSHEIIAPTCRLKPLFLSAVLRGCITETLKLHKLSDMSLQFLMNLLQGRDSHFSSSLCSSRCVHICFPAISRCYSETMCLTSCGHKTLSQIVSSKAHF